MNVDNRTTERRVKNIAFESFVLATNRNQCHLIFWLYSNSIVFVPPVSRASLVRLQSPEIRIEVNRNEYLVHNSLCVVVRGKKTLSTIVVVFTA